MSRKIQGRPCAPGALEHVQGVRPFEDVAVAEDGNVEELLQSRDVFPLGLARVVLGLGARVQRERGGPQALGGEGRVGGGLVGRVDADADLDGHGDLTPGALARLAAGANDGIEKVNEEVSFPRQRRSPALLRDLGHGAPEVQVHVVGEVALDEHGGGARHDGGVHAVELEGADALGGVWAHHVEGALVSFDQCAAGDHLGHVQSGGGVNAGDRHVSRRPRLGVHLGRGIGTGGRVGGPRGQPGGPQGAGQARLSHDAAQAPEGGVRHARHGGEDDGRP